MAEQFQIRYQPLFVPANTDPIEMTPEQEAAFCRQLQQQITQQIYAVEERLLYGRAVSDVMVIDGQTVTRPELPEGR